LRKWVVAVLVVAVLAWPSLSYWRARNAGPVFRGRLVAARTGCFACHGDGGAHGIPDPGYALGDVPTWNGGLLTMYVENAGEIREWILDGIPSRLKADKDQMKQRQGTLIPMPAFRGALSARETQDLVAYVKAVGNYDSPEDGAASEGQKVADRMGCTGCHGPGGRGGVENPGSLKGYVPSWSGADFPELARDDSEAREWIRDGGVKRLEANPVARFFLVRQTLQMPAYGPRLKSEEVDRLLDYIHWLRRQKDEP
jgi:mono/diheme cytochrome c family protein